MYYIWSNQKLLFMEQWKKEIKALDEKRILFDLSYYRLAKMSGVNIQKLKKVLEFKMIPNLKMYFDLKTVLDSHNVTVVGAEKVSSERTTTDETSFEEKGFSLATNKKVNYFSNMDVHFAEPIKKRKTNIPEREKNQTIWVAECECKIVDGLLRRGKDGCKKSKSEHKF